MAGQRSTPVPRVLPPESPVPSLQTLPLLEQGGHVQQGILNVLPQPVGILEGEAGHVQGQLREGLMPAEKQEGGGP